MVNILSAVLFESLLHVDDIRGLHKFAADLVRQTELEGFEVTWCPQGTDERTIVRVGERADGRRHNEAISQVAESDGWWAFALSDGDPPDGWLHVKLCAVPDADMLTSMQQLSRWMRPVARRLAERERVRRLEHNLELLREQADRSERLKEEFLSNLSHELRTPLTAVLGFSEILRDKSTLNERDSECVDRIHMNGERLLRLLNRLIQLAKLESDRTNLNLQKCDPADVIQFAVERLRPIADAKALLFETEIGSLPAQYLDEGLLREALQCVLENAVKFTDSGTVAVRAWTDSKRLQMEVRDTGKGIAQEHLSKVFDAFWQGDGSMTRAVGGNGIGLTLAHRLLRRMGGDILIKSQRGEGTTVSLWLPRTIELRRDLRRGGMHPAEQFGLPFQARFQGPIIPYTGDARPSDLEA